MSVFLDYSSDFMISSWVLHFVSGINRITKVAPPTQMPANKYILPWNPSNSLSIGRYLIVMNENVHNSDIQNDTQASLIRSGITSASTMNGNDRTPNCDTKTTNEKLASGIQLNPETSTLHDLSIM